MEHKLLELRAKQEDRDHQEIAATLHALGMVSRQDGDLKGAKQQLEESLRMKRSLHGDKDHPSIAATLHALGMVRRQDGDLKGAKQQLEESLRMKRSLHGDKDDSRHCCGTSCIRRGESPGWRSQGSKAAAGGVLANESLLAWR